MKKFTAKQFMETYKLTNQGAASFVLSWLTINGLATRNLEQIDGRKRNVYTFSEPLCLALDQGRF